MKQIIQSFDTGATILEEVPAPIVSPGSILIRTKYSLVSLGTEKMLVEFGKANLISKARQQPDKVKQVLEKIKAEGLMPTLETVFNKLKQPLPLGYCNVGEVEAVGKGVTGFKVGDVVTSNGPHAEWVNVPQNLVAKVPDNVEPAHAAFTVIGSIGLQGIRLANPTFGETVVVVGLGLIGLLTAQMLLANGCKVIGVDLDQTKCDLAQKWGVKTINPRNGDDVVGSVLEETHQVGSDAVIITASAQGNELIRDAARMSRKRGRIVLVGVIGLDINRSDFYEKELTFQVSCSYGPGRYDDDYEQKGIDYPLPFVRWTEKRNFETILDALSRGNIDVKELITEKVPLESYMDIYGNMGKSSSIASILEYPQSEGNKAGSSIVVNEKKSEASKGVLGIIGAGNFTKMTMLPALDKTSARLKIIASSGGVSGTSMAKKHGIEVSTTDVENVMNDPDVDSVVITTRHNSHARFAIQALNANKHVFVEKPLALNSDELDDIVKAEATSKGTVFVGFNRRFSPHTQAIAKHVGDGLMNINVTMNAGAIPSNVWVHDMKIGGGRIIGEACHLIDLCVFLTKSKVKAVNMQSMGLDVEENTDNASIFLKFENGSSAVVNYFANGSKAYSKERLELYSQERTYIMDNFRKTLGFGAKGFGKVKTKMDKGHKAQFNAYVNWLKNGGEPLIAFEEIVNVTKASFAAITSLKEERWVYLNEL
ncbi:MAG: Gfo/Idh/MocA family oxidoreductase [Flavobacteriia bacterium]|nr:Gfo/Idh/MocA family oxidoreductase [Flavobacteriia bacterium]